MNPTQNERYKLLTFKIDLDLKLAWLNFGFCTVPFLKTFVCHWQEPNSSVTSHTLGGCSTTVPPLSVKSKQNFYTEL